MLKQLSMDDPAVQNIIILGAGVQGTVFGVRLAQKGHEVPLVARSGRAKDLRQFGARIENVETSKTSTLFLPVLASIPAGFAADLCLVTVRREQIETVLPDLARATAIRRIVFLVNYANGSGNIFAL